MRLQTVVLILLFQSVLLAEFNHRIENTNITILRDKKQVDPYVYNYNRLRFYGDFTDENFFASLIADGVNYYGNEFVSSVDFTHIRLMQADTPFRVRSNFYDYKRGRFFTQIYRAFAGYEDEKNRIIVGVVNIPMGVGRIWNPTNLFNPRNVYAFEPDEIFGVTAISYTRHLDDTSSATFVTSQRENKKLKFAGIYKNVFDFAELGVNFVYSDETMMVGYDVEANLFDTGVEVRSEGAYIKSELSSVAMTKEDNEFFQGIVGADYGFVNGLNVIVELLYSSKEFSYEKQLFNLQSEIVPNLVSSKLYSALALNYAINIFLDTGVVYIESFDEKNSRFFIPSLTYTFNDYNSFVLGAMIGDGDSRSEFGALEDSYYFKWSLSF